MKCLRCQGTLVEHNIFTIEGKIDMVRCVHCGDIIDSVILINRWRSRLFPNGFGKKRRRALPPLENPIAV